jgi:ferric-dicitrate binding protein FerR (iron transport regulator)
VWEVVREHLRAPEQGAPRANAHRAAQRAPNRAKGPEAALRAAILALIGTIGRVVPDRDGWMLDAAAAAAESGNLLLALRMVLIISE